MSCRVLRSVTLLAAGWLAAACQEGAPTTPVEADLGAQAAIGAAGELAAQGGDNERAEALRDAANAIRLGIRPSQIEVKIKNEKFSYLAIVIGRERRSASGDAVLIRSLVAWTGRPTTALLHVSSKTDHALFGGGSSSDNGPGGARGQWKDLANSALWVATAGSADLELKSSGGACPIQPTAGAALRCVLAKWDVRVNGGFQLVGDDGPDGNPIEIHTNADGVNGVVISPAG